MTKGQDRTTRLKLLLNLENAYHFLQSLEYSVVQCCYVCFRLSRFSTTHCMAYLLNSYIGSGDVRSATILQKKIKGEEFYIYIFYFCLQRKIIKN